MFTADEHIQNLVEACFHREREVYSYQVNIDNYTAIVATMPQGAWPDNLAMYASTPAEALPSDMDPDSVMLVADYQHRDRLNYLLRTEKIEQAKSRRVLEAMKAQIGDEYPTLLAAYKASQTA